MEGDPDFRPWNELIPDALGLIFSKLKGQEILRAIPLVCKSWCKVVEGPYCWQRIDIHDFDCSVSWPMENNKVEQLLRALFPRIDIHDFDCSLSWSMENNKVEQVLRALIPRSSGSLRELCVSCIDDQMLSFIAQHAGSLETLILGLSWMKESTFEQFAKKLGSLTTLIIRSNHGMSQLTLQAISQNCKRLVSLSWVDDVGALLITDKHDEDESFMCSMPNLKRLSLRYALIKYSYVFSLLSGCPELEWVEISGLTLDPRAVKEKYPNIVTLNIGDEALSDSDHSDHGGDFSSYGSLDYYDRYHGSDDDLHGNYEYDIDDYGSYDDE